jgi:hypothetical protein
MMQILNRNRENTICSAWLTFGDHLHARITCVAHGMVEARLPLEPQECEQVLALPLGT